ncbi:hypothetical protein HDU98_007117 [Podochytrium sp. JEL0797]|nr:hypothetical protein HDU98_007117 [Podochytrium sp. JEL0797]
MNVPDSSALPPFRIQSTDTAPYYYLTYCLTLPTNIAGLLLSSAVVFGLWRTDSFKDLPRVQRMFAFLILLSGLYSFYNIIILIQLLYFNSETFQIVNIILVASWFEFVMLFNTALSMERYFHVNATKDGDTIWHFAILVVLYLTGVAVVIWAAVPPNPLDNSVVWKYVLPISFFFTSIPTVYFYRATYVLAYNKLSLLASTNSAVERNFDSVVRSILRNSILMTTSMMISYFPQILLLFLVSVGVGIDDTYGLKVGVNVLSGLDTLITAGLGLYFLRETRLYLCRLVRRRELEDGKGVGVEVRPITSDNTPDPSPGSAETPPMPTVL